MKTPIADFVQDYIKRDGSRFHMPGHKGQAVLGIEPYDITEIAGADVLSAADGIIRESEENASSLFSSAHSFYVTQGTTTAIYAMLALVTTEKKTVLAARNVHRSFVQACALLDLDVEWLMPSDNRSLLVCEVTAAQVETSIVNCAETPAAVYLTSPDYLGTLQNIADISAVCQKYRIPLLVDNAHGAYLKFLQPSLHPLDEGATICCDSAHKTLPVLTGGAYLHISKDAPAEYARNARDRLALFSSTSPSYLVLQSLDLCNTYLSSDFSKDLAACITNVAAIKSLLKQKGFCLLEGEPLKITVDLPRSGYAGEALACALRAYNIEPEFYDDDFLVLMITPQNSDKDFKRLKTAFSALPARTKMVRKALPVPKSIPKMSIRDAVFAACETVDIAFSQGRICAAPTVSCPPAVPIAVSGEEITEATVALFRYYGIKTVQVVKKAP